MSLFRQARPNDEIELKVRCSHETEIAEGSVQTVTASRHDITPGWQCVVTTPNKMSRESQVTTATVGGSEHPSMDRHVNPVATILTSKAELDHIQKAAPLPPKQNSKIFRNIRWEILSVYRRVFVMILTVNLIAIILFLYQLTYKNGFATFGGAATGAAANFCVAISIRNEHVVNTLFNIACSFPVSTPLFIRRRAAKIYSYGGCHSACGISGAAWYVVFAVLSIQQFQDPEKVALSVTTGITLMLLVTILVFAHPKLRARLHNHFEMTHRYCGWAAIIMLWIQTMLLVVSASHRSSGSFGRALVRSPPFWFLAIITALLIYPWTRLRSRAVRVEGLSRHATRFHFDYRDMDTCLAVRVTDAPLRETHAFATIPNYADEEKGFSILVSNAGDWTNKVINNPPSRLYVKGAPTIGVMRVAFMFKKVLIVATGSGMGPCLSLLQAHPDYPVRVLWSALDPEGVFGEGIISSVFKSDPDAVVIDSKKTGRPDLVALAYALFVTSECEAVIVVSNPTVTRKTVYGLEARHIPAYGPIFDS